MGFDKEAQEGLSAEAASWLVRLDSGTADPEAFEAWRSEDPRRAAAFAQAAAIWRRTGDLRTFLPGGTEPEPVRTAADERPHITRRALVAGLGTGFCLVAAGATALLWERKAYAETGIGERRTVRLPDGSRADLNSDTRLGWRTDDIREVWLERGEAALLVADRPGRGFLLHAQDLRAMLGTGRFNLRLDQGGPQLTSLAGHGLVSLAGDGGRGQQLAPGTTVGLADGRLFRQATPEGSLQSIDAWRRGEVVLDGMPLEAAVAEYNRYLERKLVVADPSIAGLRLGGRYFTDDPEGFLSALREGFGIEARTKGSHILLTGSGALLAD